MKRTLAAVLAAGMLAAATGSASRSGRCRAGTQVRVPNRSDPSAAVVGSLTAGRSGR